MEIKSYKSIYEARREVKYAKQKGLKIPKRLSAYEELEKYKNDPNIYISFRSIDKIGINPMSQYDTPNGIYTYPLKEIWEGFNHSEKQIKVPFAGEHPYIYVVKAKGRGINDLYKYSSKDFDKDIEKIKNYFGEEFEEDIEFIVMNSSKNARVKNPGGIMWYVTMKIAQTKYIMPGKSSNNWNLVFSKILGYNYVGDKTGQGIIHTSEPLQTVFFSTNGFTTVDKIVQDNHRKRIYSKETHWIDKAKIKGGEYKIINDAVHWKNGIWENGIWQEGTWEEGTWEEGTWNDGEWLNGTWENGTWENGVWENGTWENGVWNKGTWYGGFWNKGTWYGGYWKKGEWLRGTWKDGIWREGVWKSGEWDKGYWYNGDWLTGNIYDPKRKGNYEPDWEWKGDYVTSPISPKEYFGQAKRPYN